MEDYISQIKVHQQKVNDCLIGNDYKGAAEAFESLLLVCNKVLDKDSKDMFNIYMNLTRCLILDHQIDKSRLYYNKFKELFIKHYSNEVDALNMALELADCYFDECSYEDSLIAHKTALDSAVHVLSPKQVFSLIDIIMNNYDSVDLLDKAKSILL